MDKGQNRNSSRKISWLPLLPTSMHRRGIDLDSIFLAIYINRFIFTFFQMTDECMKTIDEHQTFYYMEMVSDCWLFLRLQLLTSIFIGVLSCATVFYRDTMGKGVFPPSCGVSSFAFKTSKNLNIKVESTISRILDICILHGAHESNTILIFKIIFWCKKLLC